MAQHELERLLPRHHRIIELAVVGHDRQAIAQVVGMTPQAISLILNSPIVQDRIAEMRAKRERVVTEQLAQGVSQAQSILEEASAQAAQTHVNLLGHEDARVQQASANAILDRVLQPKASQGTVVLIEAKNLQLLQVALQESDGFRDRKEPELELLPSQ